ncbi:ATP-binding cassette domain-containing protein [Streptomyces otsuchiensis]|uniref:ATP-binding cassette domain-containing protein n=1 Tax=Streptomyces otsuchiensis TaxID=2681388 RepID=UPI0010326A7D|nr:ATP-binding cassette domain-containing protein [Streptomyces otsuchiensis]
MLEIIGLSQGYRRKPVVSELHIALGAGAFGLLGPNGAGKSTLLRTLATISAPGRPEQLRLFGEPLRTRKQLRAARRRIGYLPQSFSYPPGFTVTDFVRHCAWLRELPNAEIGRAAAEAVDRVELTEQADLPLRKLSGGMLRRAGIAQAICGEPDLIILDEPTNGLDPRQRVRLRQLLRDLSENSCVVLSTHLVEDISHVCARMGVLYEGRLRFDGTAEELAAMGTGTEGGDTALERGYTAALDAPPLVGPPAGDVAR